MGCNLYLYIEQKLSDGCWHHKSGTYEGRSYPLFARLAGVRNYEGLTPLDEPRGLPDCFSGGDYSFEVYSARYTEPTPDHRVTSWFTLSELEAVDWEEFFTTYEGGRDWMCVLQTLRELADDQPDNIRIIFWFDDSYAELGIYDPQTANTN